MRELKTKINKMEKDKKILLDWAATYGEDKEDVRAAMYGEDLMIEFAKYYHTEQLILNRCSSQLKEKERPTFEEFIKANNYVRSDEYFHRNGMTYSELDVFKKFNTYLLNL